MSCSKELHSLIVSNLQVHVQWNLSYCFGGSRTQFLQFIGLMFLLHLYALLTLFGAPRPDFFRALLLLASELLNFAVLAPLFLVVSDCL